MPGEVPHAAQILLGGARAVVAESKVRYHLVAKLSHGDLQRVACGNPTLENPGQLRDLIPGKELLLPSSWADHQGVSIGEPAAQAA